jgi:hypothetical protein
MFSPVLEIKGYGRVIGESREGPLGGVINVLVMCTSGLELPEFVGSEIGVVVDDVQVRILGIPNRSVFVPKLTDPFQPSGIVGAYQRRSRWWDRMTAMGGGATYGECRA